LRLSIHRSLSEESTRRKPIPMTRRNRNRLIDLTLVGLVALAALASAAVTLAAKL